MLSQRVYTSAFAPGSAADEYMREAWEREAAARAGGRGAAKDVMRGETPSSASNRSGGSRNSGNRRPQSPFATVARAKMSSQAFIVSKNSSTARSGSSAPTFSSRAASEPSKAHIMSAVSVDSVEGVGYCGQHDLGTSMLRSGTHESVH